jgi:class 3 adenylate cyclase
LEQDEVAALATLSRHRLIVDDSIARHSGRVTGTAGDSVLAEARRHALLEGTTQPGPTTSPAELVAVELAFWESVRESDNPTMYEAYLEKYAEGAFAALAKARLDELRP